MVNMVTTPSCREYIDQSIPSRGSPLALALGIVILFDASACERSDSTSVQGISFCTAFLATWPRRSLNDPLSFWYWYVMGMSKKCRMIANRKSLKTAKYRQQQTDINGYTTYTYRTAIEMDVSKQSWTPNISLQSHCLLQELGYFIHFWDWPAWILRCLHQHHVAILVADIQQDFQRTCGSRVWGVWGPNESILGRSGKPVAQAGTDPS